MRKSITAALAIALAVPVSADTLDERVAKLPAPTMSSAKSLEALEYCIGLAAAKSVLPVTLHGESRVLIYASMGGEPVLFVISVRDEGERRTVAVEGHSSWDGKAENWARGCI
ncbi:hypothetical protein [Pelagerythrobacter marinus]|uniref:hypothetical protein n=1 Tax=Pelagerythrobacter marinus TaxID=538382 RepID=UPI002AC99977|nr:hypothetical protein [Pelagerythrobacter marinus]WPZ06614.1 hypothetical protein T8T98_14550 [Pelagerythrobacter marinus]